MIGALCTLGPVEIVGVVGLGERVQSLPDTQRTEPYSFVDLARRWECDEKTVARRVNGRYFKAGRVAKVRPAMVLRIEQELEGRR